VQETVQPTGGMKTKKISTSIEYMVNERFNLKFFHEWSRNIPEISTSFKTTNWNAGFSIRFTLS
jgi:cell surface protein SprA